MNGGLITIYVFVILLLLFFIILSGYAIYLYVKKSQVILPDDIKECTGIPEQLPNVNKCCVVNDIITQYRFLDSLNMIVSNNSTYYLDVCKNFCINGYNSQTKSCIDEVGLNDFNNCVNASKPVDCVGSSMPVAISGNTFYYPYQATDVNCSNQINC